MSAQPARNTAWTAVPAPGREHRRLPALTMPHPAWIGEHKPLRPGINPEKWKRGPKPPFFTQMAVDHKVRQSV